jgi:Outer membrane protein beta-barrel domain
VRYLLTILRMWTRSSSIAAAAFVVSAILSTPAHAQQVLPGLQLGGAAGISIPTGHLGQVYSAGFNVSGLAQLHKPTEYVGARAEVLWERFDHKQSVPTAGNKDAVAFVLNAMYFVPEYALRPYFIGGMGLYSVSDQGNHPGFNLGLGMDIPLSGLSAHFEARLHRVLTDGAKYTTVPFSFGVRF